MVAVSSETGNLTMNKACEWTQSWTTGNVTVIDCRTCGFKHQYPFPEPSVAAEFYAGSYYEDVRPKYLETIRKDRDHRRMWAADKLTVFREILGSDLPARPRILDIGASFGTFLEYFAEQGWESVGVEPSRLAARVAVEELGLNVHNAMLEDVTVSDLGGPFDVAHIAGTLDHLLDPDGFIARCARELVVPGGLLCIETANQFNPLQMAVAALTPDSPMWWITPDHIGYFDRDSLNLMLSRQGFATQHEMSIFPMEIFPLMGSNFVLDPAVGPACHQQRVAFEKNLHDIGHDATRRKFYETLATGGFGRVIINTSRLRSS